MALDLRSVGQSLKSIREEKGFTLEEVSKALSIEERILEGIESGDWKGLPDPFFMKGYVNHYTAFLDIADDLEPGVVSTRKGDAASKRGSRTASATAAVMMGFRGAPEAPAGRSASLRRS